MALPALRGFSFYGGKDWRAEWRRSLSQALATIVDKFIADCLPGPGMLHGLLPSRMGRMTSFGRRLAAEFEQEFSRLPNEWCLQWHELARGKPLDLDGFR